MIRKPLTIFLVLAILFVGTGMAAFVHAEESHETLGNSDCQVCFMLAASAIALAFTAALLLFVVTESSFAIPFQLRVPLSDRFRVSPCAPRAPPTY